jgi:2-amino-4-hydroxy-6-hydroxymethyldihydropteridine diphosphokinase
MDPKIILLLGSNIDPEENINAAIRMIGAVFPIEKVSSVWRSHSIGYPGPDFLNLAVQVSSDFDLQYLKINIIQSIEESLGRIRESNKSAPRTIDIDVIVFHGVVVEERVWREPFIAVPISEILPSLTQKDTNTSLSSLAPKMLKKRWMKKHPSLSFDSFS